jgi:hypothetical protein
METLDDLQALHASRLDEQYEYLLGRQAEVNTAVREFEAARENYTAVLDLFAEHNISATVNSYVHGTYIYASISVGTFSDPPLVVLLQDLEDLAEKEADSRDKPEEGYRSYSISLSPLPATVVLNANLRADGQCKRALVRVEKREEERYVKVAVDIPVWEFQCPEGEPLPSVLQEQAE